MAETGLETRQEHALVDHDHPRAGRGGVVLPPGSFWQPGKSANPGGRPKGADGRAYLRRKLAKGRESDPTTDDPNEQAGEEMRRLMDELADAALRGDRDKVSSLCDVLDQIQGKPKETIEHQGGSKVTLQLTTPSLARMELCEGCRAKLELQEREAARAELPMLDA